MVTRKTVNLNNYNNTVYHWCQKGHDIQCLHGKFISELSTGEKIKMTTGETYAVSDELSAHRSNSVSGVKLLVIEKDFLKKIIN